MYLSKLSDDKSTFLASRQYMITEIYFFYLISHFYMLYLISHLYVLSHISLVSFISYITNIYNLHMFYLVFVASYFTLTYFIFHFFLILCLELKCLWCIKCLFIRYKIINVILTLNSFQYVMFNNKYLIMIFHQVWNIYLYM